MSEMCFFIVHVCRNVWQACSCFLVSGSFRLPAIIRRKIGAGGRSANGLREDRCAQRGDSVQNHNLINVSFRIVIAVLRSYQFSHYPSMTSRPGNNDRKGLIDWTFLSTSGHCVWQQKTKCLRFQGLFPVSSKLVQ
jgi:hypothetical protein